MNSEASRKAFETFAVTVYKNISLEKDDDGEYRYALAAVGWKYWQASRKALEAEQAQAVRVTPLRWSDEREPCEGCRYNHVVADSGLGTIHIEWKGWKKFDSRTVYVAGEHVGNADTIEDAKLIAENHIRQVVISLIESPLSGQAQTVEHVAVVFNRHYEQRIVLEDGVVHKLYLRPLPEEQVAVPAGCLAFKEQDMIDYLKPSAIKTIKAADLAIRYAKRKAPQGDKQ